MGPLQLGPLTLLGRHGAIATGVWMLELGTNAGLSGVAAVNSDTGQGVGNLQI
jgi:hypothetical protein